MTADTKAIFLTAEALLTSSNNKLVTNGIRSRINSIMGSNYQYKNDEEEYSGNHGEKIETHIALLQFTHKCTESRC